ncbi:phosphoribosyltransferase [Candidatus Peregrinibacteria bacterium]|nr:phosphoribosyltransferase [Candidatus Peregrinibacteria bacterium]
MKMFANRKEAAELLSKELKAYEGHKEAIILAIPRGALKIGEVLREKLKLPLDIVVTKKIGAPGNEEFAVGVVDPEGNGIYNKNNLASYGIPMSYIQEEAQRLKHVIKRRYEDYRGSADPPEIKGKICIVVDDGIATGHTTEAAVQYLKHQKAKKVVLAVPVSAADSAARLEKEVDEFICLARPMDFYAVGQFYADFPQVSDEEAIRILGLRKT